MKILWKPYPRQAEALVRLEDEILYGGARGGGKTDAGMVWLLYDKDHPKYRALVIRKNAKDLADWIDRGQRMYAGTGARFVSNEFRFPSGARFRLGHLKDENAYTQYQGHEYQKILNEELTKIAREKDYESLLGSCRSTVPEIRPQVFNTTNPDGDGYEWVRDRFDCLNPDKKPRYFKDKETGVVKSRIFIPAMVDDNPSLALADPGYVAFLNNIKDVTLRRQWRFGSWEEPLIEGAYYRKEMQKAKEENRICNVPFDPKVRVDTWWDLGISDYMCIWFTQTIGKEIHIIDYIEGEGEGIKYYARLLNLQPYVFDEHFMPHDADTREIGSGDTRKDTAEGLGLTPVRVVQRLSQHDVSDGIDAVRAILPRCWFDKTKCKIGISRLKSYKKEFDDKRNVYKDRPVHDAASHGSDAFRCFAVGFARYKDFVSETTTPGSGNAKEPFSAI